MKDTGGGQGKSLRWTTIYASAFVKHERAAFQRRNADRQDRPAFSSLANIEWDEGKLVVRLPQSLLTSTLGDAAQEIALNDTVVQVSDLEKIVDTLAGEHLSVRGWVMDSDVDNVGLVFTTMLDGDELSIVLPTRVGGDYNQVCETVTIP